MSLEVLFSKFRFSIGRFCFLLKSLNRTLSGTLLQQNFLWTHVSWRSPQSVPCEWKCLSATYRSFVRKWNNPQCEVSGSTVHSNTRLGRALPGQGSTALCILGLQGPNFELVKLQKALTSTMVKASLSLHAEIFAFIFLCVVVALN